MNTRPIRGALGFASASLAICLAVPSFARADEALVASSAASPAPTPQPSPSFSLALERVGGFGYSTLSPSGGGGAVSFTNFSIAGPSLNPMGIPRVGFDVLLKNGITLGGAVGLGALAIGEPSNNGQSQTMSGVAFLVSPRVGYRLQVTPWLDITPRAGITLAGGSITDPTSQTCTYDSSGQSGACSAIPGDKQTIVLAAASVEAVAAVRVTRSFNLLAGASYDQVFAATSSSSSSNPAGGTSTTNSNAGGTYLGAQLWLGLGGYL